MKNSGLYSVGKIFYSVVPFLFFSPVVFAQSTDAIQMLENLSRVYPAFTLLITAFCYLMGFFLVIRGIFFLKMYGEMRTMMSAQTSIKIPFVLLAVGSILIFLPSSYEMLRSTFFGNDSMLGYDNVQTSMNPQLLRAIVGIVQIVGLISFIKGWMVLVAHTQQPGGQATLGKAATHIIGGLAAYNIISFTNLLWQTLYDKNFFN